MDVRVYGRGMEVAVSAFRSELKTWLAEVQGGQEVVLTERGIPVAKLVPVGRATAIEELTNEGVISAPRSAHRPKAAGADRPSSKRSSKQSAKASSAADPVSASVVRNRRNPR